MKNIFRFRNLSLVLALVLVLTATVLPLSQAAASFNPTTPSPAESTAPAWTDMPPVYYSLYRSEENTLMGDLIIDHDGFLTDGGIDINMTASMMRHLNSRLDNLADLGASPGNIFVDYPYFALELDLDSQIRRFRMNLADFADILDKVQPEKLVLRTGFGDVEIGADKLEALSKAAGEELVIVVTQTESEPDLKFLIDGEEFTP